MRKEVIETIHSYIEEMTTVKKEPKESKNAFLSIETVQCHLKNGKTISRDQLQKNGKAGSAVVILPITKQNTTVITIQPRVFTEKTVGIALPAGYKEANETYEEAALRELVEETGYVPEKMMEVCSFYQDEGCSSAYNKGYIAIGCEKKEHQKLDESEYIKYLEVSLDELWELVEKEYILDGGSELLIEKAKSYLEKEKEHV